VKHTRSLLAALTLLLAGCGGGGGGSATVPGGSPVMTPSTAPSTAPTTSPSSWKQTAKVTLSWHLPATKASAKARKPQYVSPSSAGLSVTIVSVNGSTTLPSWAAPGSFSFSLSTSTNCSVSSGIETCAVTVPAPPGTVVYDFAVLDSTAHTLSETPAAGVSETIAQGQSNVLPPINLEAVVASVDLSGFSTLNADVPDNQTVTITAYDADSNVIYDGGNGITYFNPFTISDPDPTGATEIIASSASCPSGSGTDPIGTALTFSGDTGFGNSFILCYTGLATNPFSLGLMLNGISGTPANAAATTTVNDITVSGTTTCNAAANCLSTDPDWTQQTLFFDSTTASAQLFSVSELGWTDNPYDEIITLTLDENATDPGYCGTGGSATVTVNPVGSNGWSVSPQNDGYCEATLTEDLSPAYDGMFPAHSSNSVSQVWFSVTSSSFNVNGIHRHAAGARKH
jgi:hypothetical protein